MKVILLQNVKKIGQKGEVKEVADGYALNHLIPNKFAVPADKIYIKNLETAKYREDKKQSAKEEHVVNTLTKIDGKTIQIPGVANDAGALYAQIGVGDITRAIKEQLNVTLDASWIQLKKPIKEKGTYSITIGPGKQSKILTLVI